MVELPDQKATTAKAADLDDAEDAAALQEWQAREAAGRTSYVGADEARRRLGLER